MGERLPAEVISFSAYVQVVSLTKDQSDYDTLSARDRKSVDAMRAARDACVSWHADLPGK